MLKKALRLERNAFPAYCRVLPYCTTLAALRNEASNSSFLA